MKHSGLGIVSCVLLIPAVVLLGFAGIIVWWVRSSEPPDHAPGWAEGMLFLGTVVLCLAGLAFLSSLLGLGLGLAGLGNRGKLRVTAGWGAGLHALLLIGMTITAILTFGLK
jgi:hypothetical protein